MSLMRIKPDNVKGFCSTCGEEEDLVESKYYDRITGEHPKYYDCRNPKCEYGCRSLGLHVRKNWHDDRCRNCGHTTSYPGP